MREGVKKCPLLKKDCIEDKCAWFLTSVKQTPPPDCKPMQFNVCSLVMIPDMLIDLIKNTAGTQAAVEDSRNETIVRQDLTNDLQKTFLKLASGRGIRRLGDGDPEG